MNDIHARAPVNRVAARVVMWRGEDFEETSSKKIVDVESDVPLLTRKDTRAEKCNATAVNLRGAVFGRMIVVGRSAEVNKRWVVRCICGRYALRTSQAIKNPNNADCCQRCRHINYLRKEHFLLPAAQSLEPSLEPSPMSDDIKA